MKLLICTQRVDKDDSILGFFHRWIEEFAGKYEHVSVLALSVGRYSLPENVSVYSLGKDEGVSKLEYISRFYRLVWSLHDEYDRVFVHMNPEYVVLGGLLWRLLGVRVGLWYTHKSVNLKLRVAALLVHEIFSASGSSFRLASDKLHILGHGIDTNRFSCGDKSSLHEPLRIISVGRITPIKGQTTIVEAMRILAERRVPYSLTFIGAPQTGSDVAYAEKIKRLITDYGLEKDISFAGSIPNWDVPERYCQADIALNMVPKGGIDKTVLEAMASGVVPLTSNSGFAGRLGHYEKELIVAEDDPNDLADKIETLRGKGDTGGIRADLRRIAEEKFDVRSLVANLVQIL